MRSWHRRLCAFLSAVALLGAMAKPAEAADGQFTIVAVPDTQFYLDHTLQRGPDYPIDGAAMFLDQMRYIADRAQSEGDIAFVTSVGDVWQHPSLSIDPAHAARGFARAPKTYFEDHLAPSDKVLTVEMPVARRGYEMLMGKVPFSVVPGNHDLDAQWVDARYPPSQANPFGRVHAGGTKNFNAVFGANTPFFKDKGWYVASFNGGADSAQVFTAAGYRFLHIGLQFDPSNDVLEWAESVLKRYPGVPTIISTHNFLNTAAERSLVNDSSVLDPIDNNPQMVWDKFISQHDQIFLVLSGHSRGAARRIDENRFGHKVYQLMADYQERAQVLKDAGAKALKFAGNGDGWLRLMGFDFTTATPTISVRTYSTHYKKFSADIPQYSQWYKAHEHPEMSDAEFAAQDDFVLELSDFRPRFEKAGKVK